MIMSLLQSIEAYWSTRAIGYSARTKDELQGDTKLDWLDIIHKYAHNAQKLRVLDIGCGAGFFSILLAQHGHEVTGIDYTEDMLVCSRRNALDAGVDVTFLKMDAQNLEFDNDTFDLVVSRNVTWALEQPEQAYREWMRVLCSGGSIVNFDENHYLYLFDEAYSKEKELRGELEYMKNVKNTHIMEKLAYDLPLSKVVRPTWDVQTLLSLDVGNVSIDVFDKKTTMKEGKEKILYNSFIVCAKK